jgi:hypothetical protein
MLCTLDHIAHRALKPKLERFPWLDPWLVVRDPSLRLLVARSVALINHHEARTAARKRARKPADQRLHLARVEVVVANLAHAVLSPPPERRLAVLLGHRTRTRYDNPALGEPLSASLWMMHELGILDYRHSRQRGEACSIAPTAWFAQRVAECGVTLADFGRHPEEEVVSLTQNDTPGGARIRSYRQRVDYRDTVATLRFREEMRRLNAFIGAADLAFVDDGLSPHVNSLDRHQRRLFVVRADQVAERFDQSGRLFGGFWQNLRSSRRRHIRINGEAVVTLDYGAMFTRLAYTEVGAAPPAMDDLYAIPSLEGYRSGVKMAMNAFLFDQSPRRSKWPAEMGVGVGDDVIALNEPGSAGTEYNARLPAGWGVGRTKKAILHVHPALRPAWGRGLGYRLMFVESQILVAVLLRLMDRGIPALGLHDGLMVATSAAEAAKFTMIDMARAMVGVDIPVSVKGVPIATASGAPPTEDDRRGITLAGRLPPISCLLGGSPHVEALS